VSPLFCYCCVPSSFRLQPSHIPICPLSWIFPSDFRAVRSPFFFEFVLCIFHVRFSGAGLFYLDIFFGMRWWQLSAPAIFPPPFQFGVRALLTPVTSHPFFPLGLPFHFLLPISFPHPPFCFSLLFKSLPRCLPVPLFPPLKPFPPDGRAFKDSSNLSRMPAPNFPSLLCSPSQLTVPHHPRADFSSLISALGLVPLALPDPPAFRLPGT